MSGEELASHGIDLAKQGPWAIALYFLLRRHLRSELDDIRECLDAISRMKRRKAARDENPPGDGNGRDRDVPVGGVRR